MALNSKELKYLGQQVARSMLLGRKRNAAGISKVKRVFPSVEGFLSKFDGKVLSRAQLAAAGVSDSRLKALSNPESGPILAPRGKRFAVRSTLGESVRLMYHPDNWPLAREIILAAISRGAHVAWSPRYSLLDREAIIASPQSRLEDLPAVVMPSMRNIDATIYLECEDDPEWKKGVPSPKLAAGQVNSQLIHEVLDSRKVKWLVLGWPFASTARRYGVSPAFFERMLFESLTESFSKRTRELVMYYKNALSGGDRVRITHDDGTDITFRIKGRPILVDLGYLDDYSLKVGDVGLNIPSGEAFCAPLEGSCEGTIIFPKIHVDGHGFVYGLKLVFKGGKVDSFTASKGVENFAKYLKENTPSTRMLAELGIGCNRAAKLTGYILTDEKIAGTIHLAIGNNTGSYHGKNKASGHLDMVKDMAGGIMSVDGRAVMEGGWPAK